MIHLHFLRASEDGARNEGIGIPVSETFFTRAAAEDESGVSAHGVAGWEAVIIALVVRI